MKFRLIRGLAALAYASFVPVAAAAEPISTQSLLREMTDLAALAEFPDPPFACRQASSYDRASRTPGNKEWFANADCGQFIRVDERDGHPEFVMMDEAGPGAIVRLWSANPMGTLRIYLDGAATPVIETPLKDFLGGKFAGVPEPIACTRSYGWSSYLPIPYAKHCKVTSDRGGRHGALKDAMYYHVNYRTYPAGTTVRTFAPNDLAGSAEVVQNAAKTMASPPMPRPLDDTALQAITLADEKSGYEMKFTGPRAITGIVMRVGTQDAARALRQVILHVDFDGYACIEAPLGDFFGTPEGLYQFDSLPVGVRADGHLYSAWCMPFEKQARLRLVNRSGRPFSFRVRVDTSEYKWSERSMHFHAKWRTAFDVPTRPMRDWNYMQATGKGVFVGTAFCIDNPVKQWWGEGDEKIYVDGETFPSHFGTGTEDYYGYAWSSPDRFTHAYHNQPHCDGPGTYGHTAVNRWHILDRIPFARHFRFDMELWHWAEQCKVTMSDVCYWYARPGGTDNYAALRSDDLRLTLLPAYQAPRIKGAIEGEEMRVIDKVGIAEPQSIDHCSNETHLWWHNGQKPGDTLVLGFNVPAAGRYHVIGRFLKAADYGIAQCSINDRPAGAPIDFYNNGIVLTPEIDLGTFELSAGENRLAVEIKGANEKAIKQYMVGVDYVRLELAR